MQVRLADYVADFLVEHGISDCFMVTGGGAMHLNDALGHKEGLRCTYNHHEQACAIAAESYARIDNRIAAVCVTTGPGGTNAITGVVGGWLDSIPMLVISGQVRYDTTARGMGLDLRAGGDQEFDITRAVSCMTKYCTMIEDPADIRYALEKALWLATHGRPGPCWVDIPLNFQAAVIETDGLVGFTAQEEADGERRAIRSRMFTKEVHGQGEVRRQCLASHSPRELEETLVAAGLAQADKGRLEQGARQALDALLASERPVLYSGAGVRWSGAFALFEQLVRALNIPVVTGWDNIDMMPDGDPLYAGRAGIMGDRPGNWAVQNADFVLAIGSRLSIRQVGYTWQTWAPGGKVAMVDIDAEELRKPTLHVDIAIQADAGEFMAEFLRMLAEGPAGHPSGSAKAAPAFPENGWQERCRAWRRDYPVVLQRHWDDTRDTNVYAFIDALSGRLAQGYTTVVGNGSACVVGSHAYHIKPGQRFIINSAIASMGYDLPAAIGACRALADAEIVCITGDGSIQMNLQELQTILTNGLPIKVFVINNAGYHSIRQTQNNLFAQHSHVGIGPESGDLSFPQMEKLAAAYGYPYFACRSNTELQGFLDDVFDQPGPVIAEVFVSPEQVFEPKSATRRLEDGSLYSPPLEDLAPFLPREELARVMVSSTNLS